MSPSQEKEHLAKRHMKTDFDATKEGGTADQSTWVNILTTSLTGEVAEPSTKVNVKTTLGKAG